MKIFIVFFIVTTGQFLMKINRKMNFKEHKRDINILIVDDDLTVLKTVTKILEASDDRYFIETTTSLEGTISLIEKTYWDTILLDLSIPSQDGGRADPQNGILALELLKNDYNVTSPIIAITGHYEDDYSEIVLDKGAYYFLNKPLKAKYLSVIVRNATRFQLSGFDGLTGLLNRVTFEERLELEFMRTKRKNQEYSVQKNEPNYSSGIRSHLSIIYFDADNFKEINDTYSHLTGDMVLKRISSSFIDESLYKIINKNETNSYQYIIRPYDLAARFGGDEFCLFLPETDHHSAIIVAQRIRNLIHNIDLSTIVSENRIISSLNKISLSIGVSTYPNPNMVNHFEELINIADAAMYASKAKKKGDIYGYSVEGEIVKFT